MMSEDQTHLDVKSGIQDGSIKSSELGIGIYVVPNPNDIDNPKTVFLFL